MQPMCEWCGQPAVRENPTLCAECCFKYWSKSGGTVRAPRIGVDGEYSE